MIRLKRYGIAVILMIILLQSGLSAGTDYYTLANGYFLKAKNDSALVYLDSAMLRLDEMTDYTKKVETLLLRSRVLGNLTFFEPAMENSIRSYDISKKNNNDSLTSMSLLSIGKVYYLMYNDSLAEDYMLQAKKLAEEKLLTRQIMITDNSLSQLYSVLERNDECLTLAMQSLETSKQLKDTSYIIQNLALLAAYYTNLNRYTNPIIPAHQVKVKQHLDEALQLAHSQQTPLLLLNLYANYVRYYRVEKNYPEALNYANKVIDMCDKTNYSMLIQMYDHLVGIYANMGDVKMTVDSHQKFHVLMRRQSDYTLHRSLQEMHVKYDVQEKELEILKQQAEISKTKSQRLVFVLATIFAVLVAAMLLYLDRIRRRQNKKLKELNATKDKLFSIVSHDLKSPMIAQRMAIDNMLENIGEYDEAHILSNLSLFQQANEAQLELLLNLLQWARIQTGELKYNPTTFDLSALIEEVIQLYQLPAQNKNIIFNKEIAKNCMAVADRQMIHTAVRNLINNALKFSHNNGKIDIIVTCDDDTLDVRIKDYGIGMSESKLKNLFEPRKNQKSSATKTETESGLGLIITKELLERNGSKLHINSIPGEGTEVEFKLVNC